MSDVDNLKGSRNAPSSAIIVLDESGDLGFSLHSSRHFTIAVTIVPGSDGLDRLIKSVRNKLGRKRYEGELKFNTSSDPTRRLMLKHVAQMDCQILWVSFDKKNLPLHLKEDRHLLYQTACEIVLREAIKRILAKKVHIVVDKRYSKRRDRDRFEHNIKSILTESHAGYFPPRAVISQYDSFMSSELQVHDFIVGAVFQHLEGGLDTYISIIESKIVFGERR